MMMQFARVSSLIGLTVLSSCDLAPIYQPPHFILPESYQGSAAFSIATPEDTLSRGPWWQLFGDPTLDQLEDEASKNNPDLQALAEQYQQARDLAAEAESGLFPQLGAQGSLSENKQSFHRLFRGNSYTPDIESSNEIESTASWEPDFWDEIRNRARAQKQVAQGSAAELASAQLSLQAELASEYMALRGLATEQAIYQQAIGYYGTAVNITQQRLAGDISSGLDVARAENQLAAAEALQTDAIANRALLLHAIADLVGVSASSFYLPPETDAGIVVPAIPSQVPASILQRRPDIAEAERSMAAANTSIGVARAAFYPNGVINAIAGFQDNGFNLLDLPNSLWSVGAALSLPLFEGGLRRAELQRAWASYAETRDNYRATVLAAFQDVEDGLSLTQLLSIEAAQDQRAVAAATRAQSLSLRLYTGGLSDYLDVVVSQEADLTAEIAQADVETRRLQATVQLISALGGGWSDAQMPSEKQVMPFSPLSLGSDSDSPPSEGNRLEPTYSDDLTGSSVPGGSVDR
jgi:NodT family efflux transporter outer membrane factor (OMF) lipoprotein